MEKTLDVEYPPNDCEAFYELWRHINWGKRCQRNILLHFIHNKKLDSEFIKFLDDNFPKDEDGYRT